MKKILLAVLSAFCLSIFLYPDLLEINTFELPNGLRVIFSPDPNMEAVAVCVYFQHGVRSDPPDVQGGSYLYQNLMFLGTENFEPYDHVLFVNKVGGVIGGRVNYDNSFFYQVVPASEIKTALKYESERLHSLRLEDALIESQKTQTYNRFSRMLETNIPFRAQSWMNAKLFEGTPYEVPVYGDLNKIRSFGNDRIRELYRVFRNPANILLLIAGKVNIVELRNIINTWFVDLSPSSRPKTTFSSSGENGRAYLYKNWLIPGLARNFVLFGFRAPARFYYDYLYFEFLRYYLCDERISRLRHVLRSVNGLDVEITGDLSDFFNANSFIIQITSTSRVDLERSKEIINLELAAMRRVPVSSSDLRAVKALMELDFLKALSLPESKCQKIAELFHLTNDLNSYNTYLARMRKITSYDIMNTIQKYLTKENQVILNVVPSK